MNFEWLLLCVLLLWTRTIPQVQMISPTKIVGVGVRIVLLLLRSEWGNFILFLKPIIDLANGFTKMGLVQ